MMPGDEAFFYHSGEERAIVGIMTIAGPAGPTARTAPGQGARDAAAQTRQPRHPQGGQGHAEACRMELIRQSRLSVSPVREEEWALILEMEDA